LPTAVQTLASILRLPFYRRVVVVSGGVYLILFLIALQDISRGGRAFQFLTVPFSRMFERTGALTFEPIAQLTLPGLTILISPVNVLIGLGISLLVGLNLAITWLAFRQPRACRFNRSTGVLASLPALLAGGACCAPAIVLILGLQVSSLLMGVFQVLIPVSVVLLVITLKLILDRTNPELLASQEYRGTSPAAQ